MDVCAIAVEEDRWNAVEVGWTSGNNAAFGTWLTQFWHNEPPEPPGPPGPPRRPDAVSEYGGGNAATYWYCTPEGILGCPIPYGGHWLVPEAELAAMPEVENYLDLSDETIGEI